MDIIRVPTTESVTKVPLGTIGRTTTQPTSSGIDYKGRLAQYKEYQQAQQEQIQQDEAQKQANTFFGEELGKLQLTGDIAMRKEEALDWASKNQDLFKTQESVNKFLNILKTGTTQEGQQLTGLGYDISELKSKAKTAEYVPNIVNVGYVKARVAGHNWEGKVSDMPTMFKQNYYAGQQVRKDYYTKQEQQGTRLATEKYTTGDYIAEFSPEGKIMSIIQTPKEYATTKERESVISGGSYIPYEVKFDVLGNILSETERTPYKTRDIQMLGSPSLSEWGIMDKSSAEYIGGKVKSIVSKGTDWSNYSGGYKGTGGTSYGQTNYNPYETARTEFDIDTGNLLKKTMQGTVRTDFETSFGTKYKGQEQKSFLDSYKSDMSKGVFKTGEIDYTTDLVSIFAYQDAAMRSNKDAIFAKKMELDASKKGFTLPTAYINMNPYKGYTQVLQGGQMNMYKTDVTKTQAQSPEGKKMLMSGFPELKYAGQTVRSNVVQNALGKWVRYNADEKGFEQLGSSAEDIKYNRMVQERNTKTQDKFGNIGFSTAYTPVSMSANNYFNIKTETPRTNYAKFAPDFTKNKELPQSTFVSWTNKKLPKSIIR